MEDLKVVFASNLIRLRTECGLTQAQLAEKINYSDKSISKWERADALPDVAVVKHLADIFGVTVDFMLRSHDSWEEQQAQENPTTDYGFSTSVVTMIAIVSIWTLAMLIFVIFWVLGIYLWIVFLAAIPVSLITLLVLNSIWNRGRHNFLIVSGIVQSLFLIVYFLLSMFWQLNSWQLIFVAILAELIVYLSFRIKNGLKLPKSNRG